jgi:hypothetical protein
VPDPEQSEPRDPFAGPTWIDRAVLPFVRESTLWPIAIIIVGHAIAFLAPLLLLAIRDARTPAVVALVLLLGGTGLGVRSEARSRGLGAFTGLLTATWALSAIGAVYADRSGLF